MAPRRRTSAAGGRIKNHLVPRYEVARVQGGRARVEADGALTAMERGKTIAAWDKSRDMFADLQEATAQILRYATKFGRGERIGISALASRGVCGKFVVENCAFTTLQGRNGD